MNTTKLYDFFGNEITGRARFFGGGAKPPKQEPVKMPTAPAMTIPKPPPPPEPIPPAPTTSKLEVSQAEEDARLQASKRRGVRQTLIAGETGGYLASNGTAKKTLLG